MLEIKSAESRGKTEIDWLTSYHSFSFGDYYDPGNKGISSLRVINDDYIKASSGFGQHPHANMEIFTFMISGELEHKDTMGNTTHIKAGEVQLMSTGTGVEHSEYNPSSNEDCHLLQVWIRTHTKNTKPAYYQKRISDFPTINKNQKILFSETREKDSLPILQDAKVSLYDFSQLKNYEIKLDANRNYWIQSLGEFKVNDINLKYADALSISSETLLKLDADKGASFLFFDLK